MIGSKYLLIMAIIVAAGASSLGGGFAQAEESVPGDQSLVEGQGTVPDAAGASEAEAHPPRSPIRLGTVDYQDAGGGGKLTIGGIGLPGKEIFVFLDETPLARTVPDASGNWSVESEMKLADGRHTLRADQYDENTNMLAARAMVSIERAKQPDEKDAAPAEPPAPKAATP